MKIIFFDGQCNFCNKLVSTLLFFDKKRYFFFATLQGQTALKQLSPSLQKSDTLIYKRGEDIYIKSDAVLKILSDVGLLGKLSGIFFIIPRPFRDYLYDRIASSRYKIFGRRTICRLPTPEEQEFFLD